MSEIVVMNPGGEDQIVIMQAAIRRLYQLFLSVQTDDFIHEHFDVFLPSKNRSDRSGNFIGRKQARCDLVEHWPEQVVVVLVENGDLNGCMSEPTGRVQSSEASTDDDHARRPGVRAHNGRSPRQDILRPFRTRSSEFKIGGSVSV